MCVRADTVLSMYKIYRTLVLRSTQAVSGDTLKNLTKKGGALTVKNKNKYMYVNTCWATTIRH